MSNLLSQGYFALFLIISLGIILGHIKIKGISLDLSAVIFVALLFGHFGVTIPNSFQKIGLLLFIFTIGIQAGPGFFEAFRKQGLQLIITAVALVIIGALTTFVLGLAFNLDFNIAVGLFTGALTSTPGLAVATEISDSPLASIGYGIAYPFGVIGVILFTHLLPKILKVNPKEEERKYEEQIQVDNPELFNQNFLVENANTFGKTIGELHIRKMTKANISRVLHKGLAIVPNKDTILHLGDKIKAIGTKEALERIKILIGKTIPDVMPLDTKHYDTRWVLVTNEDVVNKSLAQLNLWSIYNATVTRIRRSGIELLPTPNRRLRFGDRLMIACDKKNISHLIKLMGNEDKKLSETNFLPIALGIILGVLLGKIDIPIWGNLNFNLGITGGVLVASLILSRIGKTGPIIWAMPDTGNRLLRQFGLLLFLAVVGTKAGVHFSSTLAEYGIKLFVIGGIITIIPMFTSFIIGRFVFKLNLFTLLGVITGGMTSTPGLAAVGPMTNCDAPYVAYTTVYPIALVAVIICSQILSYF